MDLREQILGKPIPAGELVVIPAWGGAKLQLKAFTAAEFAALRRWWREGVAAGQEPADEDVWAKTVIAGVMREDGSALFQKSDVDALKARFIAPINQLFNAIAELNGITADAAERIRGN